MHVTRRDTLIFIACLTLTVSRLATSCIQADKVPEFQGLTGAVRTAATAQQQQQYQRQQSPLAAKRLIMQQIHRGTEMQRAINIF
jgi:hypothetical protein